MPCQASRTWPLRRCDPVILCLALLSYRAARRKLRLIAFPVRTTNGRDVRRRATPGTQQGGRDERSTGSGGYTEGRVRPDIGRPARAVGCQWPPLCGLGDL